VLRIVADLGNSRLKWGRLGAGGRVVEAVALPLDDPSAWERALRRWESPGEAGAGSEWAIASVNPPTAARLAAFLEGRARVAWYRSAADVPVRHGLERPETAGTDRALAVAASLAGRTEGGPGLVVLCGTALTVERVAADGTWQGGAIAAGLALTARALHAMTAQLPLVAPREAPPAWGNATTPALEAGVFWGVVGAVRELLTRQAEGFESPPWVVWTGGDAPALAKAVGRPGDRVVPDLILRGLAAVAFGAGGADADGPGC
jgi:type III pantothenate kinase